MTNSTLVDYHSIIKANPIIAKFHICKLHFVNLFNKTNFAKITNTHRNTVRNIINLLHKMYLSFSQRNSL